MSGQESGSGGKPGQGSGRFLRPAAVRECGALTALALRSKAYWGYDPNFIQACRDELTIRPEHVKSGRVVVLVEEATVLGLYALLPERRPEEADVRHFFIEPAAIGHGLGRLLWDDLVAKARSEGIKRLKIESDPFAMGFYRAMGATLAGKMRAPVKGPGGADRYLPVLYYDV